VTDRIEAFDKHYSRFRPDSLISEMAQRPGTYKLPADAKPLLDLYAHMYGLTDGAMTPLIGQLLTDAGYDAFYSLEPGPLRPVPAWDDVLEYKFPNLTLKKPALLDVGAAGKGYLVDIIAELIAGRGIKSFCIDAGGDIVQRDAGSRPLRVGLEHPGVTGHVIGVATITNQSLCGSAGNRRAWGAFNHIMDPHSRTSPKHIKALWVIADTALLADALATCLFFVSPAKLARYTFEYAIVYQDYSLGRSPGFPATFFTETRRS